MKSGWERKSFRVAIAKSIETSLVPSEREGKEPSSSDLSPCVGNEDQRKLPNQVATVELQKSKGSSRNENRVKKEQKRSAYSCFASFVIAAVCLAGSSAIGFSPLIVSLSLEPLQNATHSAELRARLAGLFKENYSMCQEPLTDNKQGGCYFPCSELKWIAHPTIRLPLTVARIVIMIMTIGFGAIFTLIWIKIGKKFWRYPYILVWYTVAFSMGIGIIIMIAELVGIERLLCSSANSQMDAIIAQSNPTTICNVLGILFHYFLLGQIAWFTSACFNLWRFVCRPTRMAFDTKRIFIIESVFCWLYGAVFVAIAWGFGGQYLPHEQGVCLPSSTNLYIFTVELPRCLGATCIIYLTLRMGMFLREHERYLRRNSTSSRINNLKRLKITFFVYSIISAATSTIVGLYFCLSAAFQEKEKTLLLKHLICLLETVKQSNASCTDCLQEMRDNQFPALAIVGECFASVLYFVMALSFPLTLKEPRQMLIKWIKFPFERLWQLKKKKRPSDEKPAELQIPTTKNETI